jgi:hypothetical protein
MLTITRHAKAVEFHCDRCDAPKKAKLRGSWGTKTICNGCYGNLKSWCVS